MALANRGYLQTRLQSILTSIDRGSPDPYFYTQQFEKEKTLSLFVIFDNGIDPEPAFSGSIMGRIYLDSKKTLSLDTWPLTQGKNDPWRKEILLPHVKDFEFEFLGAISASEHGKKESLRLINANYAWRSQWPKSLQPISGIIRLTVYEEGMKEPVRYVFILPVIDPFVTYREKAI